VQAVGLDWRAGPLWERYIDFEEANRDWRRLGAVFRRALATPTEGLAAVHVRLRALVVGDDCPPLGQLCTTSEAAALAALGTEATAVTAVGAVGGPGGGQSSTEASSCTAAEKTSTAAAHGPAAGIEVDHLEMEEAEEGELEDGELSAEEFGLQAPKAASAWQSKVQWPGRAIDHGAPEHTAAKAVSAIASGPHRLQHLAGVKEQLTRKRQEWFLDLHEAIYQKTAAEAELMRPFEVHLQRPYFHNKPLSEVQLQTWRRYLDFEESRQPRDDRRLHTLYARCLVAANNYLEFWLRYGALLERTGGPERVRALFADACLCGRLRRRPDAVVTWAELEEQCGYPVRARELLDEALASYARGSVEVVLRRVSVERRAGDLQSCEALLRRYASECLDPAARGFLVRQYARLCEDTLQQPQQARDALLQAWREGCRDACLLAELASLILRTGGGEGHVAGGAEGVALDCSSEAGRAAGGSADGGADGSGAQRSGAMACGVASRSAQGSGVGYGASEAMAMSIALFEEALDPSTTPYAPTEACVVWACYVDFLVAHGAPVTTLRFAQARARTFAVVAGLRGHGRAGGRRPIPGDMEGVQEPAAKVSRTGEVHADKVLSAVSTVGEFSSPRRTSAAGA